MKFMESPIKPLLLLRCANTSALNDAAVSSGAVGSATHEGLSNGRFGCCHGFVRMNSPQSSQMEVVLVRQAQTERRPQRVSGDPAVRAVS